MSIAPIQDETLSTEPAPYHWTVNAFYRAIDAGVFDHPERLELIRGELIEKMGQNPPHSAVLDLIAHALRALLEPRFGVREEKPLHISTHTEPEPDIAVVRGSAREYAERHPSPDDVLLIVEVADSSLMYDTRDKALLYAKAGIVEYWVVVLPSEEILVYRLPSADGYESVATVSRVEGSITLSAVPEITVTVGELLGD